MLNWGKWYINKEEEEEEEEEDEEVKIHHDQISNDLPDLYMRTCCTLPYHLA